MRYMKKDKYKVKNNKIDNNTSRNSSTNSNSSNSMNSEITDEERDELISQLAITNLSIVLLFIIIYAVIISVQYLEWEKAQILDQINSTNYSEELQDLSGVPRISNILYLFVTSIFTGITFNSYREAQSKVGEDRDEQEIRNTYKRVISILLVLLGTTINTEILNS